MLKQISNAEFVFLNTSSDVIACLKINSKTKIIQTWHGCGAFKKSGLSSSSGTFGADKSIQERYPYHAKYDLVTVSSPEAVWAYNDAMGFDTTTSKVTPIGLVEQMFFLIKILLALQKISYLKCIQVYAIER